jgi:hypothetical protein
LPASESDDETLDWTEARAKLDQVLAAETQPPAGWSIASVAEAEMETVEFGPLSPAPDQPPPDFARLNAVVWRVRATGETMGWLIADLDSQDATLILPWDHASTPAWRGVAREAALARLTKLPGRARWRLRIVGEEQVDQETVPPPLPTSTPPVSPARATPAFSMPSLTSVGVRSTMPRSSILGIVVALVLCIVLAFAVNRLRQQSTEAQVPALSVPGVTTGPVKSGADAIVVVNRLTPLRTEPNNQSSVLLLVAEGQAVAVSGGPETRDGQTWWRVKVDKNEGWLPEALPDGTKIIAGVAAR